MKHNPANRAVALLLLLALFVTMSACAHPYTSEQSADTLLGKVISTLSEGNEDVYYRASEDTYAVYFGDKVEYEVVQDCCIAYHTDSTNVDQLGVFRVREGHSTEPVRKMVQAYVDGQAEYLHGFAANYNRGELEKIQSSRVFVIGQYVCFSILSDEAADRFSDTVKQALKP
jgi:hypothetical protein